MRRVLSLLVTLVLPVAALAHGHEHVDEAEELGHHWASGVYAAEFRYQFWVMLVVIGAIAVFEIARHLRRVRR